jgi:hypothetical protein
MNPTSGSDAQSPAGRDTLKYQELNTTERKVYKPDRGSKHTGMEIIKPSKNNFSQ